MNRKLPKAQKILRIVPPLLFALLALFYIVLLILGEDTVMGNPILRAMEDASTKILIVCVLLNAITLFSLRLWEKKHPPKEDEPLPKDGDQHPPAG